MTTEQVPEKQSNRGTEWRRKNRERANAKMRAWLAKERAKNPEKIKARNRESRLKMKYGITQAIYEEMLRSQNGHCALCHRTPEQERFGYLLVDHCHETGKIRGLLCNGCNMAVGWLGDTASALQYVLAYLERDKS